MKPKNTRPKFDPDHKHRFCDPGACHCCENQGGGNFFCRAYKVMVVQNWHNTEHERICKKDKKEADMSKAKKLGAPQNPPKGRDKHNDRYRKQQGRKEGKPWKK
jgi:hypothetical protein